MKHIVSILIIAIIVTVGSDHRFFGTNVQRSLVYHKEVKYDAEWFSQKSIHYLNVTLPPALSGMPQIIQGFMAYDLTHTTASANVTKGGLGHDFVYIRMKSEGGKKMHYDIYIYA